MKVKVIRQMLRPVFLNSLHVVRKLCCGYSTHHGVGVLHFILSAIILCLFILGVYPNRDYEYVSEEDYPHFKIIRAAMEKHKIIPDLHKLFTFYTVQTKFMNGSKSAQMGNELSKEDTQEPPHIGYCHDDDAYYTIILSGSSVNYEVTKNKSYFFSQLL
nr:PREDICTED: uncharacterized protein LOC109037514 isoform X2 [Bemisia tabaci]